VGDQVELLHQYQLHKLLVLIQILAIYLKIQEALQSINTHISLLENKPGSGSGSGSGSRLVVLK
jgi:hypothetical protein